MTRFDLVLAIALAGCAGEPSPDGGEGGAPGAVQDLSAAADASRSGDLESAPDLSINPPCSDGRLDGNESDVDCGGDTCVGCGLGKRCATNADCTNGSCVKGACAFGSPLALAFGVPSQIKLQNELVDIVLADWNGDKKMDFAAGGRAGVFVGLGNGDGTFQLTKGVAIGAAVLHIRTADLNLDGKADMVTGNDYSQFISVAVVLGNGDGTFAVTSVAKGMPSEIAVADLNRDKKPDLVIANGMTWQVRGAKGDGTFNAGGGVQPQTNFPLYAPVAGDLDHDGLLDIVFADGAGHAQVILDEPVLKFGYRLPHAVSSGGMGAQFVAIGDLNADGALDLVVVNTTSNNMGVLLGDNQGTFTAAPALPTPGQPIQVVIADVNGDARPDLVEADVTMNACAIYVGKGDGKFDPPVVVPMGLTPSSLAVGDLNGDGKPDLAMVSKAGNISIALNASH